MSKQIKIFVLLTFVCLVHCIQQEAIYFVGQESMVKTVADSEGKFEDCAVFTNRPTIDDLLKDVPSTNVIVKDETSMIDLVTKCNELHQQPTQLALRSRGKLTHLGTQWCGSGSTSSYYGDLGTIRQTGACCKKYDNCKIILSAWTWKYGLYNRGYYTISDCDCDHDLFRCLKGAAKYEIAATSVGKLFFKRGTVVCISWNEHTRLLSFLHIDWEF